MAIWIKAYLGLLILSQVGIGVEEIMARAIKTIDRAQLRTCLNKKGHVAFVFVKRTDVILAGTRSERVDIDVEVVSVVHGTLGDQARLTRYTKNRDTVLEVGKYYVIAVTEEQRFTPRLWLEGFVEASEGFETEYVNATRLAIEKILKNENGN